MAFICEESVFREVTYESLPQERQLTVTKSGKDIHSTNLEDFQTSVKFSQDKTDHVINFSLGSPVMCLDHQEPKVASFSKDSSKISVNIGGTELRCELQAKSESLLVLGRIRPDVACGLDLFTFQKLFNPGEKEELEAVLDSRPALEVNILIIVPNLFLLLILYT